MTDLFGKTVNMSLSASVVILTVVVARFLLRGAPKKWSYLLWSVVGFRLACPVSFTSVLSIFRAVPVKPAVAPVGQATTMRYIPALHPQTAATPQAPVSVPVPGPNMANGLTPWNWPEVNVTPDPDPFAVALLVATMVWVIGMAVLLLYTVVSYLETRRTVSAAVRLEGNVWQSDQVGSPFILGFVRPKIYIPFGLEGERLQYVLEHERYHLQRRDHIVKALAFILLAVHWFNPLCWLAFTLMGKDMEMSCDEKVLQQNHNIRKAYSTTLLSFATGGRFPNASPLAFGETAVKTRIKNALNWKQPKTWVTLLAGVAALALVVSCAVNPAAEGPRESEGPVESQSPAPVQTNAPLRTSGEYGNVENYVNHMMDRMDKVTYYNDNGPVMVGVADRKLDWLEKQGELVGLAPNGTLELWTYNILVKLPETIDPNTVILAGGMYGKDGYFDLEGQGGHRLIALTYSDGTCDILYDAVVNDGGDLPGATGEEALYNWYVTHYDMDMPPYLISGLAHRPQEYGGDTIVEMRLYQGDGWYIYIPTSAWSLGSEGEWTDWVSQYTLDAYLVVQHVTGPTERPDPGEYRAETYYDKGDGTGWYVTTSYDPRYTPWDEFSGRGMVPGELSLMASTFTVDDRATRTVPPQYTPPTGETFGFTGEYATLYTAVARELGAGLRGVAGSGYEVILPSLTVYGSYPADEAVYFGGETVKEATHYVCALSEHYYYGFDRLNGTHLMEGGGVSLARITLSADGQDVHIDQEWDGADNTRHFREICGPYTDVAAFYNRETQTQPPHTDLKADLGQYVRWCWEKSGLVLPVSGGEGVVAPVPTAAVSTPSTPTSTPTATPEPSPSPAALPTEEATLPETPAPEVEPDPRTLAQDYFSTLRALVEEDHALLEQNPWVYDNGVYLNNLKKLRTDFETIRDLPAPNLPETAGEVKVLRMCADWFLEQLDFYIYLEESEAPPLEQEEGVVTTRFRDWSPERKWQSIRTSTVVVPEDHTTDFLDVERACARGEEILAAGG